MASEASVSALVTKTIERFNRIDYLVNNAALASQSQFGKKLEELSLEQWQMYMNVNVTSLFLCCKHAIPHLRESKGSIVNIASTRAIQSEPHTEAYSTSKGAAVAFTHSLANSLGPLVRVNAISPGWICPNDEAYKNDLKEIHHSQHVVGRVGKGEDIAQLAYFLCNNDLSGFITGQNFVVDGGMTKKMIYVD